MGLLDTIMSGSRGGYGGLLDALMFQSPLNKPQEVPQSQYDAMGNFTGVQSQPTQDPFGPTPNMAQWAQQFAPQNAAPNSAFGGGAAPFQQFAAAPAAQPAPQPAPQPDPQRTIGVGGYQMPQIGSASDFTPQSPTDVSAQSRAPQMPQTQPTFMGNSQPGMDIGDRLNAGLQNFANSKGVLPAIAGGISGLMSGNRTDPAGVSQQNLKAQYDALVPTLGPQKAMLAVMNPEAGKILLAQALEKKQYGFTKLDSDTLLRTDPLKGTAEVVYGGNEENKAGIAGPDGKIIPYPAGLDAAGRKTFANEIAKINADAAGGKKTEVQANAEQFGNRMENAEQNFSKVSTEGVGLKGAAQGAAGALPLGGFLQSNAYRNMEQAKRQWVTALLRKESGAAIGKQEYADYDKQFFPQPEDGPQQIAQKAEARKVAVAAMKRGAGPGYQSPASEPARVRKYNPATGTIE